jgi:hypothetical protein
MVGGAEDADGAVGVSGKIVPDTVSHPAKSGDKHTLSVKKLRSGREARRVMGTTCLLKNSI